jgi:hypothetical protein
MSSKHKFISNKLCLHCCCCCCCCIILFCLSLHHLPLALLLLLLLLPPGRTCLPWLLPLLLLVHTLKHTQKVLMGLWKEKGWGGNKKIKFLSWEEYEFQRIVVYWKMLVGFFVVFKSLDWRLNWVVSTNFHDGEERDASQIGLFPKIPWRTRRSISICFWVAIMILIIEAEEMWFLLHPSCCFLKLEINSTCFSQAAKCWLGCYYFHLVWILSSQILQSALMLKSLDTNSWISNRNPYL